MGTRRLTERLDRCLWAALHASDGSARFWRTWREYGLDDARFARCVAAAMGNNLGIGGGGTAGRGRKAFAWLSSPPRLWLDLREGWPGRTPALEGEALLARARQLLRVPLPMEKPNEGTAGAD